MSSCTMRRRFSKNLAQERMRVAADNHGRGGKPRFYGDRHLHGGPLGPQAVTDPRSGRHGCVPDWNGIGRLGAQTAVWILFFILGYIGCFALSVGPVTWVILSEIFPTRVRAGLSDLRHSASGWPTSRFLRPSRC